MPCFTCKDNISLDYSIFSNACNNFLAEVLTAKVTPLRELVEVVEAGDAMEE